MIIKRLAAAAALAVTFLVLAATLRYAGSQG